MAQLVWNELNVALAVLAAFYLILFLIPLVQLIRTRLRVPDLGWTTQKMFLTLTWISAGARAIFFIASIFTDGEFFLVDMQEYPVFTILDVAPDLFFFTTYTLIVLFWAEIIHHARNQSLGYPQKLRPTFFFINFLAYLTMLAFCLASWFLPSSSSRIVELCSNIYRAIVFLSAALGFVSFGGRLYMMLRQFPIESRGRQSKLSEVGWVTVICSTCFVARAGLLLYSTYNIGLDLEYYWIATYYGSIEALPCLLVLFILRKLPPARQQGPNSQVYQYQRVNDYDPDAYKVKLEVN